MVIPTFEPIVGGAERQLQGVAAELVMLGHEVLVATRRVRGCERSSNSTSGYRVCRLPTFGVRFGFHISLAFFLLFKAKRFDVVHCHTLSGPAQVCALICSLLGVSVLLKITRSGPESQIDALRISILSSFVRLIWRSHWVHFVAITKDTMGELVSFGVKVDKCTLIPNGVRIPDVRVKPLSSSVDVVYTGRLIKRKRVDILLSAFSGVARNARCRLSIIGGGPLRDELERDAVALGISGQVEFTGELSQLSVSKRLIESDVFVLPSESEGMSNSLLEAMATGLLVMAADIKANREVVSNGCNGILFTDVINLKSQLEIAINDVEWREKLGTAARRSMVEGYSFQAIASRYAVLYKNLLKTR